MSRKKPAPAQAEVDAGFPKKLAPAKAGGHAPLQEKVERIPFPFERDMLERLDGHG